MSKLTERVFRRWASADEERGETLARIAQDLAQAAASEDQKARLARPVDPLLAAARERTAKAYQDAAIAVSGAVHALMGASRAADCAAATLAGGSE